MIAWIFAWMPAAHAEPPVLAEAWVEATASVVDLRDRGAIPVEGRRTRPDGVEEQRVLVPPDVVPALRAAGHHVTVTRADHQLGPPPPGYHDPQSGGARLRALAALSDRAHHVVLGRSVEGRFLDALVMGQDVTQGAPTFRILAAHHGDEWSSFEVALAVANALVTGDGLDDRITGILDRSTVWVVPYVNPDGVLAGRRTNAHGVDLNRDYDYAWSTTEPLAGPVPFSEPETRAIRGWAHHNRPMAGLSLHSGAANLGWVWNHTTSEAPEAPLLEAIAADYADRCTAPGFWITNGARWFVTHGDLNDWSYGRYGVPDFTLELTDPRVPPPEEIPDFVSAHLDAVLDFLDRRPTLSGRVLDPDGAPVESTLQLDGPVPSAAFANDPLTGRFHRVAVDPERLWISAPGYHARELPLDPDARDVEIVLEPADLGVGLATPWQVQGPATIRLPEGVEGPVTLVRTGTPSLTLAVDAGIIEVDGTLAPGSWAVVGADGRAWPRALWVDDVPDGVAVDGWHVEGELLVIEGVGFATGARAWQFEGETRRMRAARVVEESPDRLVLDLGGAMEERVDVGLWTAGAHLGLADVRNTDGPPWSDTTGEHDDGTGATRGGCACGVGSPLYATWATFLGTTLLMMGRRRSW